MSYGAPYPDIYDWTWGEVSDFVTAHRDMRKAELRENAAMYFKTAALVAKMLAGSKGETYSVTEEYSFLWSEAELNEMRVSELMRRLEQHTTTKEDGGNG